MSSPSGVRGRVSDLPSGRRDPTAEAVLTWRQGRDAAASDFLALTLDSELLRPAPGGRRARGGRRGSSGGPPHAEAQFPRLGAHPTGPSLSCRPRHRQTKTGPREWRCQPRQPASVGGGALVPLPSEAWSPPPRSTPTPPQGETPRKGVFYPTFLKFLFP